MICHLKHQLIIHELCLDLSHCGGLNEHGPYILMFECFVSSCWNCLGRIRRCGLIVGGVLLEVGSLLEEVWRGWRRGVTGGGHGCFKSLGGIPVGFLSAFWLLSQNISTQLPLYCHTHLPACHQAPYHDSNRLIFWNCKSPINTCISCLHPFIVIFLPSNRK